jgi:hypothetical protein
MKRSLMMLFLIFVAVVSAFAQDGAPDIRIAWARERRRGR